MFKIRSEFTAALVKLLSEMVAIGERPVIDYVLRSPEEQFRLYAKGRVKVGDVWVENNKFQIVTQLDGFNKKSNHNRALAADIYFSDKNGNVIFNWSRGKSEYWHKRWQDLGGQPIIMFADGSIDAPHFD